MTKMVPTSARSHISDETTAQSQQSSAGRGLAQAHAEQQTSGDGSNVRTRLLAPDNQVLSSYVYSIQRLLSSSIARL